MGGCILHVPYKSQNDADATLKRSDCGPACVAMILNASGQNVTTNQVTKASGVTGDQGVRINQLKIAAKVFELELNSRSGLTLDDLKAALDNGQPPIALINYGLIPDRWDRNYSGGHFVVLVGYDDAARRVFINDPDYPPGAQGYQRPYAFDVFSRAWSGFARNQNPNNCLIVPQLARSISGTPIGTPPPSPNGSAVHAWVTVPHGIPFWSQPNVHAQLINDIVYAQHVIQIGSNPGWLQVITDSGLSGWVADRFNNSPTLSNTQPPAGYPVEVLNALPIRDVGGWSVRAQRNLNAPRVDRVAIGEHATVYMYFMDTDNTPWLLVQSPRGRSGWGRESTGSVALVRNIDLHTNGDTSTTTPGTPPAPNPVPVHSTDVWVTAIDGLVLRESPEPSAHKIAGLPFGQRLIAIGPESPKDNAGRVWQHVRTENGWAGFVVAGFGAERYLSLTQPPKPYTLEVLDTQFARSHTGLSILQTHEDSAPVVDRAQVGEHLTAYNRFADTSGTWVWLESPRNKAGWLRDKIDGAILVKPIDPGPTPNPIVDPRPFGKCLTGLGMGNPQPLSRLEFDLIGKSKIEAFKILTLPDPGDTAQLIRTLKNIPTIKFVIARLFFSVDAENKTRFSPQRFVETVFQSASAAYQAGVRYFEIHNEPNLENEGLNWNWRSGAEFGAWLSQVVSFLRTRFPEAQLGFPGLSPQPNVPDFLNGARAAIQQCDWLGAHCYWQSIEGGPYPMTASNAGMYWRSIRDQFPGKLVMLTEFSNNSSGVDLEEKGRQYARYYQLLRSEVNLGAAFSFALNWPGQDANHEGWEYDGKETTIPGVVGGLLGQAGFLG
jgi:hypothetical protein